MSPVEPDSSHGKITYGTSSSSGYEVEPNSNGKSKNFQQGRNEESAKSKKKENHYTTNAGNRDNFDNTRQFDNNIKYTIASCGLPSSPPKEEDDEYDNEVASILRNARMRESPRSLLELDRKYLDQKKEELHDHDSYIADGEDNNHTTRRYLPIGDSSSNETKNLVKRPSTGSISSNKNKNAGRKSSFDATTKETLPIKPPPITRKLHIDMFPTFVPNAENEEMYSPTNQINAEYPYEKSAGPTYVRDIVKGSETDSRPPKHAFGSYGSKWNSPTPSLPGLCPSSNDTVGSGYGSLDYSSGTDQSHETLPASNRRVLVAEDRMKKSSIRKGRRMNKPKPCPKSSNRTEQLPLVPEDISTRGEENGLYSEDQYLVRNGRSETQYNNELRSPKKKKQRQIFISHLLDEVRGCKQPASCHDKFFAILFYAQVIIISLLGIRYGPQAFGYNGIGTGVTVEYGVVAFTYKNVIILTLGSGLVAIMISSLLLFLITTAARSVIPLSLFIAMTLALIGSVISIFFSPETYVPIIGLVSFGVCVVFTFIVWDRIPFVTAQLNTALSALKEAYSIIVLACIMQIVALVVIIFYFFTCIGIYDYFQVDQTLWPREWKIACYVGLVISFTWTFEVLSHLLRATTCAVVHKWWFSQPNELKNLDVVRESFLRASSISFGSVCLGSLFIGPTNFLRHIADYIRPNKEEAVFKFFVLFQELIVSAIDFLNVSFCNWSFAYVGIYNYNYLDAGNIAQDLFHKRGWKKIIRDDILPNVLLLISLIIGGVVGCVAVLIEYLESTRLYTLNRPSLVAYIIGTLVGVVLSNVLFSIISSSVDTVIICFAGSPDEFEKNHPKMSQEVRLAWRDAWPGTLDHIVHTSKTNLMVDSSTRPNHLLGTHRQKLDEIFV